MSGFWSTFNLSEATSSTDVSAEKVFGFLKQAASQLEGRLDSVLHIDGPENTSSARPSTEGHTTDEEEPKEATSTFASVFKSSADDLFSSISSTFTPLTNALANDAPTGQSTDYDFGLGGFLSGGKEEPRKSTSSRKSYESEKSRPESVVETVEKEHEPVDTLQKDFEEASIQESEPPIRKSVSFEQESADLDELVQASVSLQARQSQEYAELQLSTVNEDAMTETVKDVVLEKEIPVETPLEKESPLEPVPVQPVEPRSEPSPDSPVQPSPSRAITPESTKTPRTSLDASQSEDVGMLKLVISQRERQLMTAMEENRNLNITVEELRKQISSESKDTVLDSTSKKQINDLKKLLADTQASLKDKEEIVQDLMREGEKLSKNDYKHQQTIKQLKEKQRETEKSLGDVTKKLEAATLEISDGKDKISRLIEAERKLHDAVKTLGEQNDQQAKQILNLESDLSQAKTEKSQLQSALERSWAELAESRRQQTMAASQIQTEALEREQKMNQDLNNQLTNLKREAETVEIALRKEVADLRSTITRTEEEAGWKEDNLRKEITSLQQRLQSMEARNEDLNSSLQESTRPLLRQIDALQSQNQIALKNWEQLEHSLMSRLHDAEAEKERVVSRERTLNDRLTEVNSRLASSEAQLSEERQEKARLSAEVEASRQRITQLEQTVHDLTAKLDSIKLVQAKTLDEAKESYQKMIRQQLEEEREKWEAKLKEQVEKAKSEKPKLRIDTVSSPTLSKDSPILNGSARQTSFAFTNQVSSQNVVVDRLQTVVKQLEGQVASLQQQLATATTTRDELAEELVKLTSQQQALEKQVEKMTSMEKELDDLNKRYAASLELLGEKTELVEELKNDILDSKAAYKEQLENLLSQLEAAKSK